jgi:glycosyltransferase involved in cell wall biosynthesis
VPESIAHCSVLLPALDFGGHERMLIEWLREAQAQGLVVRVHCRDIPELVRQCHQAGLSTDSSAYGRSASGRRFVQIGSDLSATWRIMRRIPAEAVALFAPGVVQAQAWLPFMAVLRRQRSACYVPMAYASSHMGFRHARLRDALAAPMVRHVGTWITISEFQRRMLVDQWRVRGRVHVVPNRLNLNECLTPHRAPRAGGPLRMLFVGRFEPKQKGLDWLAEQLHAHHTAWQGRLTFTFKGAGDFEPALRALADAFPGNVAVSAWGDITDELLRADVLLLPSRFEGLPLVAIEALHHGLPVVASDRAGLGDVLPPACLFPFGDFHAMRRAIEDMGDPAGAKDALAHARSRLQALVSKERFDAAIGAVVRDFAAAQTSGSRQRTIAP